MRGVLLAFVIAASPVWAEVQCSNLEDFSARRDCSADEARRADDLNSAGQPKKLVELTVSRAAWEGLSPDERAILQNHRVINVREAGTYGLVIDNQGVDQSQPGTTSGAYLGSTVSQAAYIDRAFRGNNNYSALGQVGMGILGAVIGSTLDRPPVQQYQFRYALKLSNGEIASFDSVQYHAFRHPAGICLSIPDLSPISQSVCNHTSDDLRRLHLVAALTPPVNRLAVPLTPQSSLVQCKAGNQPPFSTTAEVCKTIGGIVL